MMKASATFRVLATLLPCSILACQADVESGGLFGDVGDTAEIVPADDSVEVATYAGPFSPGEYARVCNCSGLNQRSGPGSNYSILRVLPEGTTVRIVSASGSWYQNDWGGRVGWSYGSYLCPTGDSGGGGGGGGSDDPSDTDSGSGFDQPRSRTGIINVGKAAVGFSYWWGGARFASGVSRGACYGHCPSCSHSGSYGADCSGFLAKAWMLPEAMPMSSNLHPFSSYSFRYGSTHWSQISRSGLMKADALAYNSSGSGHVVLFESGDGWGSMWTYESRGCSYGVVHNVRTLSSSYKGIRRDGI